MSFQSGLQLRNQQRSLPEQYFNDVRDAYPTVSWDQFTDLVRANGFSRLTHFVSDHDPVLGIEQVCVYADTDRGWLLEAVDYTRTTDQIHTVLHGELVYEGDPANIPSAVQETKQLDGTGGYLSDLRDDRKIVHITPRTDPVTMTDQIDRFTYWNPAPQWKPERHYFPHLIKGKFEALPEPVHDMMNTETGHIERAGTDNDGTRLHVVAEPDTIYGQLKQRLGRIRG